MTKNRLRSLKVTTTLGILILLSACSGEMSASNGSKPKSSSSNNQLSTTKISVTSLVLQDPTTNPGNQDQPLIQVKWLNPLAPVTAKLHLDSECRSSAVGTATQEISASSISVRSNPLTTSGEYIFYASVTVKDATVCSGPVNLKYSYVAGPRPAAPAALAMVDSTGMFISGGTNGQPLVRVGSATNASQKLTPGALVKIFLGNTCSPDDLIGSGVVTSLGYIDITVNGSNGTYELPVSNTSHQIFATVKVGDGSSSNCSTAYTSYRRITPNFSLTPPTQIKLVGSNSESSTASIVRVSGNSMPFPHVVSLYDKCSGNIIAQGQREADQDSVDISLPASTEARAYDLGAKVIFGGEISACSSARLKLVITQRNRISAGQEHSCSTQNSSSNKCWGRNQSGQAANALSTNVSTPTDIPTGDLEWPETTSNNPRPAETIESLATGTTHSCALTDRGSIYCWGSNSKGQLGIDYPINSTTKIDSPQIKVEHALVGSEQFIQVSARQDTTCALTFSGRVYCWGANNKGQVGDGTTTDRARPVLVSDSLRFKSISVGGQHVCGVTSSEYSSEGDIWCWGNNSNGEAGVGSSVATVSTPNRVLRTYMSINTKFVSVSSGGGAPGTDVNGHTCAVTTNKEVYCWGSNVHGQLGLNDRTNRDRPTKIPNFLALAVSTGGFHSCALNYSTNSTINNAFTCWGHNAWGQLGNNDSGLGAKLSPPVPTASTLKFAQISAGYQHSCAMSLTGEIACWGTNDYSQVGFAATPSGGPGGGARFLAPIKNQEGAGSVNLLKTWARNDDIIRE